MSNEFPDCSPLPPNDRRTNYRALVEQMHARAELAPTDEIRTAYLILALQWRILADRLESENPPVTVRTDDAEQGSLVR